MYIDTTQGNNMTQIGNSLMLRVRWTVGSNLTQCGVIRLHRTTKAVKFIRYKQIPPS